jgi:hypothetical protein
MVDLILYLTIGLWVIAVYAFCKAVKEWTCPFKPMHLKHPYERRR